MRMPTDSYCRFRETDFTRDAEIRAILGRGVCAETWAEACLCMRRKEQSPVAHLPADLSFRLPGGREIPDLRAAADFIAGCDDGMLFDTMDLLGDAPILLKVSGAFSALLSVMGSESLFRQLTRPEAEIADAIGRVNAHTAGLIRRAVPQGVRILSFADPSALPEVIGERRYLHDSLEAGYRLFRSVDPFLNSAVMHLCPRISSALESLGLCACESRPRRHESLLAELLDQSRRPDVHFTGHLCIHAGKCPRSGLTVLKLKQGQNYENTD